MLPVLVWTAAGAALLVLSIIAHEAGHAVAMRHHGVAITEFGFGIPAGPRLVIPPGGRRSFAISVSPVLVMAYVTPADPSTVDELPYRDGAWCEGAGIVANLLIAFALFAVYFTLQGAVADSVLAAAFAAGGFCGRRVIARWLIPAIALPSLLLVALSVTTALASHVADGPAGAVAALVTSTPARALLVAASLNLSIALVNSMPLYPLDGGRIARRVISQLAGKRAAAVYLLISPWVTLTAVAAFILTDVVHFTSHA